MLYLFNVNDLLWPTCSTFAAHTLESLLEKKFGFFKLSTNPMKGANSALLVHSSILLKSSYHFCVGLDMSKTFQYQYQCRCLHYKTGF